jgi:hypothetical protein
LLAQEWVKALSGVFMKKDFREKMQPDSNVKQDRIGCSLEKHFFFL